MLTSRLTYGVTGIHVYGEQRGQLRVSLRSDYHYICHGLFLFASTQLGSNGVSAQ